MVACPDCHEMFEIDGPDGIIRHLICRHPDSIQARVMLEIISLDAQLGA